MPRQGTSRASGTRSSGLSREVVLRGALALIDEEGADALTLRRLAERLGVNPMAAYYHVHGKDAILDGVAELVTQDIHLTDETGPWQARLRELCMRYRRAVRAHPNALAIIAIRRHVSDSAWVAIEQALRALEEAGFSRSEALRWYQLLSAFMTGFVSTEPPPLVDEATSYAGSAAWQQVVIDHPRLAEVAEQLASRDLAEDFAFGVDQIIARIESAAPNTRRARRR